jgi:prophage antirepressor-like protein
MDFGRTVVFTEDKKHGLGFRIADGNRAMGYKTDGFRNLANAIAPHGIFKINGKKSNTYMSVKVFMDNAQAFEAKTTARLRPHLNDFIDFLKSEPWDKQPEAHCMAVAVVEEEYYGEGVFIYEHPMFGKLRCTMIDNAPWFMHSDVCRSLDLSNSRDAMDRLKGNGVAETDVITTLGTRKANFINEGNLYRLVMRSNKPEAEGFQDWVCDEVIPQIRKTGGYSVEQQHKLPQTFAEALEMAAKIERERMMISAELVKKEEQLQIAAPKVKFHDDMKDCGQTWSFEKIAAAIPTGMSDNDLRKYLADKGWMYHTPKDGSCRWMPTIKATKNKWLILSPVNSPWDKHNTFYMRCDFTYFGITALLSLLHDDGIVTGQSELQRIHRAIMAAQNDRKELEKS